MEQANLLRNGKLFIILGFVVEKDLSEVLPMLPTEAIYYFVTPPIPRGLSNQELKIRADKFGLQGTCMQSVQAALDIAKRLAQPQDLILITGSFFIVGEAYSE
jgi:dihydrofolate synthase/folylpolyglutamate synthase